MNKDWDRCHACGEDGGTSCGAMDCGMLVHGYSNDLIDDVQIVAKSIDYSKRLRAGATALDSNKISADMIDALINEVMYYREKYNDTYEALDYCAREFAKLEELCATKKDT